MKDIEILEQKLETNSKKLESIVSKISNLQREKETLERKIQNQRTTLLNLKHKEKEETQRIAEEEVLALSESFSCD